MNKYFIAKELNHIMAKIDHYAITVAYKEENKHGYQRNLSPKLLLLVKLISCIEPSTFLTGKDCGLNGRLMYISFSNALIQMISNVISSLALVQLCKLKK